MGDHYEEDRIFQAFNQRKLDAESRTTGLVAVLLTVVAGLYTICKVLEFLGYPVWLWVHMAVDQIGSLRLLGGSWSGGSASPNNGSASGDDTQNPEMQRGNMLSRAFALTSSNLLQKGVRGVAGAFSKGSNDAPPGLGNWDNSCYQNSVIQGMASLPSLHDYLAKATVEYSSLDSDSTNGALFDIIKKLNDPGNHGQHFWVRGKLKSMSTFQQQDAQEYYSKILDALDKEVRNETTKRRSSESWLNAAKIAAKSLKDVPEDAMRSDEPSSEDGTGDDTKAAPRQQKASLNPLDGLLAQRVGCINCGYTEGLQLIPFNCVTVSLGSKSVYDIRECLDEYTNLEYIQGVECAKCTLLKNEAILAPLAPRSPAYAERLKAVQDALADDDFDDKTLVKKFKILKKNWTQSTKSRQAVIARAPKALVLHVNRSIFDEMTGAQYKNTATVAYPRILDLGNWCLGSDETREEWPRDPNKSMLCNANAAPMTTSPFQYRLRAAVTHYGSHGNGHYVCYRPHAMKPSSEAGTDMEEVEATGEQWWRFSDDSVYAVPEAEAHQGNVFMLFYERMDGEGTILRQASKAGQQTIAREDDIPLPTTGLGLPQAIDGDIALSIPLPDEDDDLLADQPVRVAHADATLPPVVPSVNPPVAPPLDTAPQPDISVYPTSPHESSPTATHEDTEVSEADSEEATSILFMSEDEADTTTAPLNFKIAQSPHLMRTAGESSGRGEGNRASLPMVTA